MSRISESQQREVLNDLFNANPELASKFGVSPEEAIDNCLKMRLNKQRLGRSLPVPNKAKEPTKTQEFSKPKEDEDNIKNEIVDKIINLIVDDLPGTPFASPLSGIIEAMVEESDSEKNPNENSEEKKDKESPKAQNCESITITSENLRDTKVMKKLSDMMMRGIVEDHPEIEGIEIISFMSGNVNSEPPKSPKKDNVPVRITQLDSFHITRRIDGTSDNIKTYGAISRFLGLNAYRRSDGSIFIDSSIYDFRIKNLKMNRKPEGEHKEDWKVLCKIMNKDFMIRIPIYIPSDEMTHLQKEFYTCANVRYQELKDAEGKCYYVYKNAMKEASEYISIGI